MKLKSSRIAVSAGIATALVSRILLLSLIPLRSSPTFQMDYSSIAKTFGLVPVAAVIVTVCYVVIACILAGIGAGIPAGRANRIIGFSFLFSLFWFIGVLETVPALGTPFSAEALIGITDIIPLVLMGFVMGLLMPYQNNDSPDDTPLYRLPVMATVTAIYVLGRYFSYAVIHINSGYLVRAEATFLWTLSMGVAISLIYCFFRKGLTGRGSFRRAVHFGVVVFGVIWFLFNFFMPLLFDISFVEFNPPIMNYVLRVAVDVIFVTAAVYVVEKTEPQFLIP